MFRRRSRRSTHHNSGSFLPLMAAHEEGPARLSRSRARPPPPLFFRKTEYSTCRPRLAACRLELELFRIVAPARPPSPNCPLFFAMMSCNEDDKDPREEKSEGQSKKSKCASSFARRT